MNKIGAFSCLNDSFLKFCTNFSSVDFPLQITTYVCLLVMLMRIWLPFTAPWSHFYFNSSILLLLSSQSASLSPFHHPLDFFSNSFSCVLHFFRLCRAITRFNLVQPLATFPPTFFLPADKLKRELKNH